MTIKDDARAQFSRRSGEYSRGIFSDPYHLNTIVGLSGVKEGDRVLDVATGGGFLACAYAKTAGEVIGLDLTPRMLETAEMVKKATGLGNVSFRTGDVEDLPFEGGSFDVVSCRFAFHHFPDPQRALAEMVQVLKKGGRLVIVDGISPEDTVKCAFLNEVEKMRDPSHVRLYPLSELKAMMRVMGLTVLKVKHVDIDQDVEGWLGRADPVGQRSHAIRRLLEGSMEGDRAGVNMRRDGGRLLFTYDTVIMVMMKGS